MRVNGGFNLNQVKSPTFILPDGTKITMNNSVQESAFIPSTGAVALSPSLLYLLLILPNIHNFFPRPNPTDHQYHIMYGYFPKDNAPDHLHVKYGFFPGQYPTIKPTDSTPDLHIRYGYFPELENHIKPSPSYNTTPTIRYGFFGYKA